MHLAVTRRSSSAGVLTLQILSIAILYVAAGRIGQLAAIPPGHVSAIWPASGIALAAVLFAGKRVWPGIWLGSAAVNAWVWAETSGSARPWAAAAAIAAVATGATAEALLAAHLIRRYAGDPLRSAEGVVRFVTLGALVPSLVGSTIGATALSAGGLSLWAGYESTWWTWWLGDSTGILVVTPLVLAWRRTPRDEPEGRGLVETSSFGALLLAAGALSFWDRYSVASLVLPLLVWAAFRFGWRGATAAIVAFSGIAIAGAVSGHGPFVQSGFTFNESLLLLQGFMATLVLTTLILTAVVAERERAATEARRYRDSLEIQVDDRTRELRRANEELDSANRTLQRLSSLDGLTGVANRRRFAEALDLEWRRARRSGAPLSLAMADIDDFKAFNDSKGHPEGDECLRRVAASIEQVLGRAGEVVARYGGDEFVLLLPGSDVEDASTAAEKLRSSVERAGVVTISLGIATAKADAEDSAEQLLARADRALYRAKDAGRNRVLVSED
jgi:diguanylate cyclase (GGDEF)-like protein